MNMFILHPVIYLTYKKVISMRYEFIDFQLILNKKESYLQEMKKSEM